MCMYMCKSNNIIDAGLGMVSMVEGDLCVEDLGLCVGQTECHTRCTERHEYGDGNCIFQGGDKFCQCKFFC